MRFAFIDAEKALFPIDLMCEVLQVSRSGFYAWRRRPASTRSCVDKRLAVEITSVHVEHKGRYGSPRIQLELRDRGFDIGRRRISRLMRQEDLWWRKTRRFRTTTNSDHAMPLAPNVLDRCFQTSSPDTAWVGDITYIWTDEGWLYLAAILDVFSRRVVGWAMGERITATLALDALRMALSRRQPPCGLVHHSDRGSQYASLGYRAELAANGIVCSMSRKGNCWDNAVAESFFATLKGELVDDAQWATRTEARQEIFEYLEVYYNGKRRHSTLGFISPVAFELQHQQNAWAS